MSDSFASPSAPETPSSGEPAAKTVLAGKYQLIRKIGEGGMGEVFLALQLSLQRQVAVKLFPSWRQASQDAIEAFIQEARVLASIEHEAIVRIIDADQTQAGQPFLVLEYLQGATLASVVKRSDFLPWRWSAEAILQVLAALDAMHRAGILHLDVKPSNCFTLGPQAPLAGTPHIKLIDFGLARLLSAQNNATVPRWGTPAYSAPEQEQAERVDQRADLYAVGVMLYELLTGHLPRPLYDSASTQARSSQPWCRAPSAVNPAAGIPETLDVFVMRALRIDPKDRFTNAAAMADALRELQHDNVADPTLASPRPRSRTSIVAAKKAQGPNSDTASCQLERLRASVESFWIAGVLGEAVHNGTLACQRRTLERQWLGGWASAIEPAPPRELAAADSLLDVFEAHRRALLIIGSPGCGKTTQLLLLARELLHADFAEGIPVVFTLSTWTPESRSIDTWLVDELYSKYQVPRSLGQEWMAQGYILPLLDGLDEVPAKNRAACVNAINRLQEAQALPGLVVTCRVHEYRALSSYLQLDAAVHLHELSSASVSEYLGRAAVGRADQSLAHDSELQSVASNPLMLSLLAKLDNDSATALEGRLGDQSRDHLSRLWDLYVEQALTRSGKKKLPVTRHVFMGIIEQLAYAMKTTNRAIFQLDELQPVHLMSTRFRVLYAVTSRMLAALLFGVGFALAFGKTPLHTIGLQADFGLEPLLGAAVAGWAGLVHALAALARFVHPEIGAVLQTRRFRLLCLGSLSGLLSAATVIAVDGFSVIAVIAFELGWFIAPFLSPHSHVGTLGYDIQPVEALRFSWRFIGKTLPYTMGAGAMAGVFALVHADRRAALVSMAYVTIIGLLITSLRGRLVETQSAQNGAVHRSLRLASLVAAVGFCLTVAAIGGYYGLRFGVSTGVFTGAVLWLWFGGFTYIQHWILRVLLHLEGARYCDATLLAAAADRGLLHRVGGGHMFLHPLFRDHLAKRYQQHAASIGGNSGPSALLTPSRLPAPI